MKLSYVTAAACALLAGALPGDAHATPRPPDGFDCRWTATADPRDPSGGTWLHTFDAGPLTLVDDDPAANPVFGTVTCSLRAGWLHTSPLLAEASSLTSPGVVTLPPTVVPGPMVQYGVQLCTRVDVVGGPTLYSDGVGGWTTNAHSPCMTAVAPEVPPRPVGVLLDLLVDTTDAAVCPRLAALAPGAGPVTIDPTGDTYVDGELFWDCPPYEQ